MSVKVKWGAPGTGKTHVLKKILFEHGYPDTLLITFSRNTADDIKFKVSKEIDVNPKDLNPSINTIHGACFRLLGGQSYAEVVDTKRIKEFNDETGYNFKISTDSTEQDSGNGIYDVYTWLSNTETPINNVDNYPDFRKLKIAPSNARKQIRDYIDWKKQNGLIDFTDMLSEVLKKGLVPDVDLLLVDEFQDLTSLQYKIFQMWTNSIDNVVVAGDPLQSIYGFMGGTPDHFKELTGDTEIIPHSYRLSKSVWDYAVNVAASAGMDTPNIETASHKGKIKHVSYRNYVNDVDGWEGTPTHTVYHLVRAKYQAPAICKVMADNGIIWAGLGGWTDSNINVFNSIIRVRNGNPLFKIHLKTLASIFPGTLFNFFGNSNELFKHIETLENAELPHIQGGLITPTLYSILTSDDPTKEMEGIGKTTRLKLKNALKRHTTTLLTQINTKVLTIHSSKGLDAGRVYLHTGISSNVKKGMRADPAAEARVFYVGITRAINELVVVKDKGVNYPLVRGVTP